jgi:hypothetical protein
MTHQLMLCLALVRRVELDAGDGVNLMSRPILENFAFWLRLGAVASALWVCIFVIAATTEYFSPGQEPILFAGLATVWIVCLGVPWLGRALKRDQR